VVWSSRRCPEADVACASAAALPWASGYFDVVLSIGVFGYLSYKQQEEAAAEIFRVLAPGGVAFLNVPNRFSFFDPHNYVYFATWLPRALQGPYVRALSANGDHIESWLHSGPGWRSVFERAGFQVKTLPVKFSNSWRTADEFQLLLTKPGAEAR
jgi:SAM-dependent methyltransferase